MERFGALSKEELMKAIADEVHVCVKCPLHRDRRNAVPGEGNVNATVMFVGEAPGRSEDLKGLPFVGAAGKVLDGLLQNIGLARDDVFITNVVKCRPPSNRDPKPNEVGLCTSLYLDRQLGLVQPKVVVTLGRHSTLCILSRAGLDVGGGITKLREKTYPTQLLGQQVLVVPMYHPAAVLHNPRYRNALENDFTRLRDELISRGYL